MGYLWPFSVQRHFQIIQCTCLKMSCNSKMVSIWSKRVKFGVSCSMCMGYLFSLLVIKSFWGHIRFTCLKMACTSKTAGRRAWWRPDVVEIWAAHWPSHSVAWDLAGLCHLETGLLSLSNFKFHSFKQEWNLGDGGRVSNYVGLLWHFIVQGHLGSFGALVSKWPVARNAVEYNSEIWDGVGGWVGVGVTDSCSNLMKYLWPFSHFNGVPLTFLFWGVILGHTVHLVLSENDHWHENSWAWSKTDLKFGVSDTCEI